MYASPLSGSSQDGPRGFSAARKQHLDKQHALAVQGLQAARASPEADFGNLQLADDDFLEPPSPSGSYGTFASRSVSACWSPQTPQFRSSTPETLASSSNATTIATPPAHPGLPLQPRIEGNSPAHSYLGVPKSYRSYTGSSYDDSKGSPGTDDTEYYPAEGYSREDLADQYGDDTDSPDSPKAGRTSEGTPTISSIAAFRPEKNRVSVMSLEVADHKEVRATNRLSAPSYVGWDPADITAEIQQQSSLAQPKNESSERLASPHPPFRAGHQAMSSVASVGSFGAPSTFGGQHSDMGSVDYLPATILKANRQELKPATSSDTGLFPYGTRYFADVNDDENGSENDYGEMSGGLAVIGREVEQARSSSDLGVREAQESTDSFGGPGRSSRQANAVSKDSLAESLGSPPRPIANSHSIRGIRSMCSFPSLANAGEEQPPITATPSFPSGSRHHKSLPPAPPSAMRSARSMASLSGSLKKSDSQDSLPPPLPTSGSFGTLAELGGIPRTSLSAVRPRQEFEDASEAGHSMRSIHSSRSICSIAGGDTSESNHPRPSLSAFRGREPSMQSAQSHMDSDEESSPRASLSAFRGRVPPTLDLAPSGTSHSHSPSLGPHTPITRAQSDGHNSTWAPMPSPSSPFPSVPPSPPQRASEAAPGVFPDPEARLPSDHVFLEDVKRQKRLRRSLSAGAPDSLGCSSATCGAPRSSTSSTRVDFSQPSHWSTRWSTLHSDGAQVVVPHDAGIALAPPTAWSGASSSGYVTARNTPSTPDIAAFAPDPTYGSPAGSRVSSPGEASVAVLPQPPHVPSPKTGHLAQFPAPPTSARQAIRVQNYASARGPPSHPFTRGMEPSPTAHGLVRSTSVGPAPELPKPYVLERPSLAESAPEPEVLAEGEFNAYGLPTADAWEAAMAYPLTDSAGRTTTIADLLPDQWIGPEPRVIIVFLRHFWCAVCHEIAREAAKLRREVLSHRNVEVVLIGNGSFKHVETFKKWLGLEFDMLTDESMDLYRIFGMREKLIMTKTEDYPAHKSRMKLGTVVKGLVNGMVHVPWNFQRVGSLQQMGGEVILAPGERGKPRCVFIHRVPDAARWIDPAILAAQALVSQGTPTGRIVPMDATELRESLMYMRHADSMERSARSRNNSTTPSSAPPATYPPQPRDHRAQSAPFLGPAFEHAPPSPSFAVVSRAPASPGMPPTLVAKPTPTHRGLEGTPMPPEPSPNRSPRSQQAQTPSGVGYFPQPPPKTLRRLTPQLGQLPFAPSGQGSPRRPLNMNAPPANGYESNVKQDLRMLVHDQGEVSRERRARRRQSAA